MSNPRVQATFKRSRHNNLSIFIISQDYYESPKRTIWANGNIYYIFEPDKYKDVQIINQDESSMGMTLNEFKNLTSTWWNEKYQPLTIDMSEDKYTGRQRLELTPVFVPDSSLFQRTKSVSLKCYWTRFDYTAKFSRTTKKSTRN